MANGFLVSDERDWEGYTADQRGWMIFKTLRSMDERLKALERKSKWDKACAAVGGVIGGFVAAMGIRWWS